MSLKLFVIYCLSVLLTCQIVNAAPSAPPPNQNICELERSAMQFCNCDADTATVVTCYATTNNSTEDNPVWSWFQYQPKINTLKLSAWNGMSLQFFPKQILPYLSQSLTSLTVSELNFTTLATGSIQNMNVLEEIDFTLCERMTVQRDAFQSLPKLKKVTFTNSNFTSLTDMFEDVPQIEEVYLEDNKIVNIEKGAFTALHKLKYIYLDRNQISHITRDTFTGLNSLRELYMNRNQIKYLPPFVFAEMTELTSIDLASNSISMIDANAFSNLPNLQSVKLERNKLRTFPAGGVFSASPNLMMVDLAFNEFEYLSWQVFYQPEHKRYIRMRIKGNSLQCTCSIAWMSVAYKSYDSIIKQELGTIDCLYDKNDGDQLEFPDPAVRPKTISDFITSKTVAKQCKLPTALVQEQGPIELPEETEAKAEETVKIDDEAKAPKKTEIIESSSDTKENMVHDDDDDSDEAEGSDKKDNANKDSELISKNDNKMNQVGEKESSEMSKDPQPNQPESEPQPEKSDSKDTEGNKLSHASFGSDNGAATSLKPSFIAQSLYMSFTILVLLKIIFVH